MIAPIIVFYILLKLSIVVHAEHFTLHRGGIKPITPNTFLNSFYTTRP